MSLHQRRIIVVLPSYNASATLAKTYAELPHDIVDEVILVDDASVDDTVRVARDLGIPHIIRHDENLGYGGNQKTCYAKALALGADVVVMVHPDYQYCPGLTTAMSSMIARDIYDVVLGSRILGGTARSGGMPGYKYIANRLLTGFQNLALGAKLSEYHTGLRAFSREVLETLPLAENSDDFVFDNQMLVQIIALGFRIGEVSCPTRYAPESSSIGLRRSVIYGLGVLGTTGRLLLHRGGWLHQPFLDPAGRRLTPTSATHEAELHGGPEAEGALHPIREGEGGVGGERPPAGQPQ